MVRGTQCLRRFYSVLPSAVFAVEEAPELRASGAALKTCTQRPGDIIFVGESFGHATLNTAPSIGFALEFCMADLDIKVNVPPLHMDLKRQQMLTNTNDNDNDDDDNKHNGRGRGDKGTRRQQQQRRIHQAAGAADLNTLHQPYTVAAKGTRAGARRRRRQR